MSDDLEILEKSTVFQGYFRVDRYWLRHRTHTGGWTQPLSREIFERGHAVGVLLYDPKSDQVGLIEQFRPGALAAGLPCWIIEIVAGIIDDGEEPEQVAVREAHEETGVHITPDDLIPISHYLVSPGGTSETIRLYCARTDATKLTGFHGLAHEGEDIRVFTVPADEAVSWIASGKINNALTIIALQWLALNKTDIKNHWTD